MPDIPDFSSLFADATVLSSTTFNEAVYKPAATPVSFEVINGWLDEDNADASKAFEIDDRMMQRGELSRSGQVGSTMALDFFSELFNGESYSDDGYSTADALDSFIPIPGANVTFYVRDTPALVLVRFNIVWESDLEGANVGCPVRFAINGRPTLTHEYARRVSPNACGGSLTRFVDYANQYAGYVRVTSSDFTANAWNSMGLQIAVPTEARQVRVRNRAIRWVQLL